MATGDEGRGRERAMLVRRELGIDDAPVADMIEVIEARALCDVAIERMPDGMHGMVATDPDSGRSIIAVATTDSLVRQRSSLAHELGHLELGGLTEHVSSDSSARTPSEVAADSFARHLLAPLDGVRRMRVTRQALATDLDQDLSDVVRTFQVSPEIAMIQMRDTGWISQGQLDDRRRRWSTRSLATRFGWRAELDAWAAESLRPRPPRRLLARTLTGYVSGAVSIAAVATVMGVDVDTASRHLEEDGIRPDLAEISWFDPDA